MEEAKSVSENFQQDTLKIPLPPEAIARLPIVGKDISEVWTSVSQNPKETLGEFENQVKQVGKWLLKAVAGIGLSVLMFVFSIIIAGVFLAKANGGKRAANRVFIRLAGDKGAEMTDIASSTIKSVVNGILGIAVLQTFLAGIGFVVMDIPAAGAIALVCLVLAVVQIDILLILIPLSIYAFSTSDTGPAIAFLIWNVGVGLMNNVLKPILLGRGVEAPMAVIFIGAIGGMLAHGIIGLFVGAVVMTLGYTLFKVWLEDTAETSLQSPSASSKE
ncbi:MAG: AI-2E family transporter [Moraxellaceae bacterium]|nr:MAG: AI-2E family transporter [Moraxellaceae bacterium]